MQPGRALAIGPGAGFMAGLPWPRPGDRWGLSATPLAWVTQDGRLVEQGDNLVIGEEQRQ